LPRRLIAGLAFFR
jgi:proteic killer suppression protein